MSERRPGLVLLGAGRMGRLVYDAAARYGFDLLAAVAHRRSDWLDPSLWREKLPDASGAASLLVDFSAPEAVPAAARWCADHGVALLSGTTGLTREHQARLTETAESVPVLWAANFSAGVNLCLDLVARTAGRLRPVQEVHVTDIHHQHKKDAPSGTALALGMAAAPFEPRYASTREGEVVGEHRVKFLLEGEEVEITHRASDRGIYARGALQAGRWLLEQPAGLYTAADWMNA